MVRKSYDDPKYTFDVNAGGTINVLEAIQQVPSVKALVLITSDKCYENIEQNYAYKENDRLGGKDPYSASKACAEIAANAYFHSFISKSTIRMATSRAGNVMGGGDWALDRVVPDFVRAWSEKKELKIRNPQSTRPWQHVLEPLSGYLTLGANLWNSDTFSGQSYNFGPTSENCPTVKDLIIEFEKTLGKPSKITFESSNEKSEATLLQLSIVKAQKELFWHPTLTFEQNVSMTADWYRSFYEKKLSISEFTSTQIQQYYDYAVKKDLFWTKN